MSQCLDRDNLFNVTEDFLKYYNQQIKLYFTLCYLYNLSYQIMQ